VNKVVEARSGSTSNHASHLAKLSRLGKIVVECKGSGSLTIMALQVLLHFARSRLGQDAIAHEHTINRFAVPHFDLIPYTEYYNVVLQSHLNDRAVRAIDAASTGCTVQQLTLHNCRYLMFRQRRVTHFSMACAADSTFLASRCLLRLNRERPVGSARPITALRDFLGARCQSHLSIKAGADRKEPELEDTQRAQETSQCHDHDDSEDRGT
jgi:hypothetical protein